MRVHVVVRSIHSREVARAQRSGVRHGEDVLKPFDFDNGLFSVHSSQYLTERQGGQIRSSISKDRNCAIRPLPVDSPATSCHGHPEEFFRRRSPCIVVQRSGALVETASMPRVGKPKLLEVEMMTELMA